MTTPRRIDHALRACNPRPLALAITRPSGSLSPGRESGMSEPKAESAGASVESERRRLDAIAADSWYAKGVNATAVAYCARVFGRHWRGTRCLELGPAEGLMTEVLA